MLRTVQIFGALFLLALSGRCYAQVAQKVVDIPTRQGVTQRMLVMTPQEPKAAVILFAGGHGGLQIGSKGALGWGSGNFLVRSRQLFADQGLMVLVVDAPSDRQSSPYMAGGFRTSAQHLSDIKAVIAWLRKAEPELPVWLVGTSHGTQSAAFATTQLSGVDGPDGLVLTSTVLNDNRETPVPAMALGKVRVPVLVVHHVQDGCGKCPYSEVPALVSRFTAAPKKELLPVKGGESRGDPCEAWSHHGFNGNEREVVGEIANWIVARKTEEPASTPETKPAPPKTEQPGRGPG